MGVVLLEMVQYEVGVVLLEIEVGVVLVCEVGVVLCWELPREAGIW